MKTAFGPTIQLASGTYFDYTDPWGSEFTIWDIGLALGRICRYAGHCIDFYSVAEHSVYASMLVGKEDALATLLHDAPEFVMVDLPKPLKNLIPRYSEIEDDVAAAIYARLGVPYPLTAAVKHADLVMLATEQKQIMPTPEDVWPCLGDIKPADIKIACLPPHQATDLFMNRYLELTE